MVRIIAKNISKYFKKGRVIALDKINLTIENGERFGILGPSGAGKTTLMRIIAGLEVPSEGELYFDDKLVAKDGKLIVPPEDRRIGMVFQTWALYPNLTAYENIAFPLTNTKISKEEIRKRVEEIAKILDITHVLNHYPRELSGGQQQRVALARALVKNPSLLLLDEPFSNLDARMRDSARALVKEVQSRLGVTLLIVSHDPADIFAIADRVGVLVKGKLVQVGPPEEIYNKPISIEVASLIGEINEIEGKVTKEGIIIGSFKIPVNINTDKAIIGIRPEDIKISKEPIKEEEWILIGKGRVKVIGYQGGLFRITVSPLDSEEEIVTYLDHPIKAGEEILVYVKKGSIKIFT
ncbi:glucose ABC transporter ATP-binding protein GlcV [Saccharolobus caldissimus]|uniref:ABC transporter ATP-binding protein n=1 Tax=Saccharolobus caldissimus TaxID=1702097 RepID=A0AAQ4CVW2_9CREN|nr:glucose ABC transporter ATP-binding protein GlcV [Saccharolobus caldissimus]BDB99943.1 ABC transporter ATP-binding protein [Saccharolobus caldissimus]